MKVYNTEKVKQELIDEAYRTVGAIEYEIQKYEKEKGIKPDIIELTQIEYSLILYAMIEQFNYAVQDIDKNDITFAGIKVIIV